MSIIYDLLQIIIKLLSLSFIIVYLLVTYAHLPLEGGLLWWVVIFGAFVLYAIGAMITHRNEDTESINIPAIIYTMIGQYAGWVFVITLIFFIFFKLDYHTFLYNGEFDEILIYSVFAAFLLPSLTQVIKG